jgi:hypothetical protein
VQLTKKDEEDAVANNTTTEAKAPEVTEVAITTTLPSSNKTEANLIDKEDAEALEDEEEQLALETDRQQQKRNIPQLPVKQQKYNNWFGRNDWSQRIQKVQGRIRFKNQGY